MKSISFINNIEEVDDFIITDWNMPVMDGLGLLKKIRSSDEFKEMPVPNAETPPRPEGSVCIENAPAILTGGTNNE